MQNASSKLKQTLFVFLLSTITFTSLAQTNKYAVYALKFATLNFKIPVAFTAVGTTRKDSTEICYILYLLKGNNKTILVDAGFTETPPTYNIQAFTYVRPDSILKKLNINPNDITDIILTHPHWDHIGGIDLFPNAMVWMQEQDFNYFVGTAWQKDIDNSTFNSKDVHKIIQKNIDKKLTLIKGDSIEIMPNIRVFTGSKHSYESQYVSVGTDTDKVIIASDNSWFYYNLTSLLSVPITFDQKAYVQNLKRMKNMVKNIDFILPGHDKLVFSKFQKIVDDIVKIK
ncbi:MAG: N-acyl homoserine lactonase family protein [Chitinophagaceae bacterium]|nr:N-acyl homoserine lactonase family protein [Chitinophagaceae bacterium]